MLKGGSQTWTLKGYQGFISSAAAVPAVSASAPSTAKPIVFVDCVMPLSQSVGSRLRSVGTPLLFRRWRPSGIDESRRCPGRPMDFCASFAHCKFRNQLAALSEKSMALSLRQINYFIATAEAGKLSLAASQLGVSQSAVTEAIKALEHETGVALLRRHAKGIELTFEGNQFLRHARAVVTAVSDAALAPRQARSGVSGSFSLAMTYT